MIWGQVVESDQLYSAKTERWYPVVSTSTTRSEARIRLAGISKPLIKPVGETVPPEMIRRGATGKAVDLFVVAFSGPTRK